MDLLKNWTNFRVLGSPVLPQLDEDLTICLYLQALHSTLSSKLHPIPASTGFCSKSIQAVIVPFSPATKEPAILVPDHYTSCTPSIHHMKRSIHIAFHPTRLGSLPSWHCSHCNLALRRVANLPEVISRISDPFHCLPHRYVWLTMSPFVPRHPQQVHPTEEDRGRFLRAAAWINEILGPGMMVQLRKFHTHQFLCLLPKRSCHGAFDKHMPDRLVICTTHITIWHWFDVSLEKNSFGRQEPIHHMPPKHSDLRRNAELPDTFLGVILGH